MGRKMAITVDDDLVRPRESVEGYRDMAADAAREREAED
jgi:hypothetical protein